MRDHDLIVKLKNDVDWLKWAVFMLYPLLLTEIGINLFRGVK